MYSPAEPRDTCPLICLILASRAARHLPAHLPDTRQLRRATPAGSSAQRHTYTETHTPLPVMAELMLTQAHTRTRGMRSDERPPREAAARVRVRFSERSSDNIRAYDPALPSGRRGRAGPAGGTVKSLGALQLRPTASAPSVQGLRTHVPPQTPH